jgi:hypothetical protein
MRFLTAPIIKRLMSSILEYFQTGKKIYHEKVDILVLLIQVGDKVEGRPVVL